MHAVETNINVMAPSLTVGVSTDGTGPAIVPFSALTNFNAVFLGMSGAGKTHKLREILPQLCAHGITVHILDNKDDFSESVYRDKGMSHLLSNTQINDIDFCYVNGNSGIDIFRIPSLPEAGGLYMVIREIVELCKLFNPSFSPKMGGYLEQILKKVYADKGIAHDDQASWASPVPTIEDLVKECFVIQEQLESRVSKSFLHKFGGVAKQFRNAVNNPESTEESLNILKDKADEIAKEYINGGFATERDYYTGWNKGTIDAVTDTVRGMLESKLFSRQTVGRVSGVINRYRLKPVAYDHRKILMRVIMNQVLSMAMHKTSATGNFDPVIPSHIIVLDEAKHGLSIAENEMSPVNRIPTEGRGFGLGLWCGAQTSSHLTLDMVKNSALKFIFPIEQIDAADAKKKFAVTERDLRLVSPKKSCLYTTKKNYTLVE